MRDGTSTVRYVHTCPFPPDLQTSSVSYRCSQVMPCWGSDDGSNQQQQQHQVRLGRYENVHTLRTVVLARDVLPLHWPLIRLPRDANILPSCWDGKSKDCLPSDLPTIPKYIVLGNSSWVFILAFFIGKSRENRSRETREGDCIEMPDPCTLRLSPSQPGPSFGKA